MSKTIYKPKEDTPAWEYSKYAVSLYKGCVTPCCNYCFMDAMRKRFNCQVQKPTLKESLISPENAKKIFAAEMFKNKEELKKHGLFFSFTSDFLPETTELLMFCVELCLLNFIPVKILTKQTAWIDEKWLNYAKGTEIAFGFTLTNHDEMERGCAKNQQRIEAMRKVKGYGFKTFASIEPIIDFQSSLEMIRQTVDFCDLYKVGTQSGKKYDYFEALGFLDKSYALIKTKVYYKDSLLKLVGIKARPIFDQKQVGRDYNIFEK